MADELKNDNRPMSEPDNMGRMNDPDGAAFIKGICGDSMEMYLIITDGTIAEAKFFTDGCDSSRLSGATAARLATGRSLMEALRLSPAEVIDAWGEPAGEIHCAILAVSTLHRALADYLIRVQNS
jgi:nitrogen fixation NifU-like protein